MTLDDLVLGSSLEARGQVNKETVFYVVNGEQRKRAYAVPADPQSPAQISWRIFWRNGMEYWHAQVQSFRDTYNIRAKKYYPRMLGFNLFMRDWIGEAYALNVIKSIQTGTQLCNDGANDVAINAVETAKSIVIVPGYHCGSSLGVADEHGVCGAELTSSTNLRIHAVKGVQAAQPSVCWQVVEFF